MFLRVIDREKQREVLVNVGQISKIEVTYMTGLGQPVAFKATLDYGASDPSVTRLYKIFVAGDEFLFHAEPGNPGVKILEDIYKNAVTA